MDRNDVINALRSHQIELIERGFRHVAIFGSFARGEAGYESDVDLLVELDSTKDIGFGYVATVGRLCEILGRNVDVVTLPVRRQHLLKEIERDRVNAF